MISRIVNKYANEKLDNLVESLRATTVLSDSFKERLLLLIEFIGTTGGSEYEEGKEQIDNLKNEMESLSIFSPEFIKNIHYKLAYGLAIEISKRKK